MSQEMIANMSDLAWRDVKIYFAGSISGGREDLALYRRIIAHLKTYGQVLTEHIGDTGLSAAGEAGLSDVDIYRRDREWLEGADVVVAEVSTPSLGVGYEVATAEQLAKPVLCLFRPRPEQRLSAMLAGNPQLTVRYYRSWPDVPPLIAEFLSDSFRRTQTGRA
jgi:hypothetical protein